MNESSRVESFLNIPDSVFSQPVKILCKFVIVKHVDQLVFIWGPVSEYPYHANLLEKFCDNHNLPCQWANKPTMLETFDSCLQIHGGGYAEIQADRKQIVFGGRSTAYGRFIRSELDTVLEQNDLLEKFSHTVRTG